METPKDEAPHSRHHLTMSFPYQKDFEKLVRSMSPEDRRAAMVLIESALGRDSSTGSDTQPGQLSPLATAVDNKLLRYCATQTNEEARCMRFGMNGAIHLYQPYSWVKIYVSPRMPPKHYQYLVRCTKQAVNAWNLTFRDAYDPRPRFEVVDNPEEATCDVVWSPYGTSDCYATSYFPGSDPHITVYALSFEADHRPWLAHFLVHELVHVQGGRHYHAPQEDLKFRMRSSEEFGVPDEFSVCAYLYPPRAPMIRPSDVEALQAAYSYVESTYRGLSVIRHSANPRPHYMDPDPYHVGTGTLCAAPNNPDWLTYMRAVTKKRLLALRTTVEGGLRSKEDHEEDHDASEGHEEEWEWVML